MYGDLKLKLHHEFIKKKAKVTCYLQKDWEVSGIQPPSLLRNGSRSGSLKLKKKKRIGTRHPDPAGSGTGSATLILTIDIRQKDRSESETI